jgi:hypothetical protein
MKSSFDQLTVFFSLLIVFCSSSLAADGPPKIGASYNEVWKVVTQRPQGKLTQQIEDDIKQYGSTSAPTLPQYSSKVAILMSMMNGKMKEAANRTIAAHEDYRDHFEKLVHANGICFSGNWEITEDGPYSGFFRKGSAGLIIGRISTASPVKSAEEPRSIGFAGKLFPTLDEKTVVKTANFFAMNNINATKIDQVANISYTNEPPKNLEGVLNYPLKVMNDIFEKTDLNPGIRPLYPIARLGETSKTALVVPKWIRIGLTSADQAGLSTIKANDFRDEFRDKHKHSLEKNKRGLRFVVEVADAQATPPFTSDGKDQRNWKAIGQIQVKEMVVEYGCDRRLHFAHPKSSE